MEQYPLFLERIFLRSPSINVAVKIRLNSLLSATQVVKVCEKLILRHPLLAATVEIKPDRKACFMVKPVDSGGLVDCHNGNQVDWIQWYTEEDLKLCNLQTGPLFKIGLFRYPGEGKTDIVFLAHHVVGDGMAFVTITRSFLDYLTGDTDVIPKIPPFYGTKSTLRENIKPGLLSRYFSGKLNKAWQKTGRVFTEQEYQSFRKEFRTVNEPGICIKIVDNAVLTKWIELSKATSATMNELIICALVASLQKNRTIPGGKAEIGIAINIRNDVQPAANDCLGNFVSGVLIRARYNFNKSFEENLDCFKTIFRNRILNKKKRFGPILFTRDLEPDFVDSIYFAEYGHYESKVSKQLARILGERNDDKSIGISNLGRIEINRNYALSMEDMVFIPPAYPANLLTLGLVTCNGQMSICFRYFKKYLSAAVLETIYADMVSVLTNPLRLKI